MKPLYLLCIFLIGCLSCKPPAPCSCMENPGNGKLLVFIGEKIEVVDNPKVGSGMDGSFIARYKILELVCGTYEKDTIEFTVYDHYGEPEFSKYKNVLLYVTEDSGRFYHEKYMFSPVFKTKNNQWAAPVDGLENSYRDSIANFIKPVRLDFAEEVSFDVSHMKKHEIYQWYPKPFYRFKNGKAIAVYGNYVPELLELAKNRALGYRGLFGNKSKELLARKVELEDLDDTDRTIKPTTKDLLAFDTVWHTFLHQIRNNDLQGIKRISADSVVCSVCEGFTQPHFYNDAEPVDSFLYYANQFLPETELLTLMETGRYNIIAKKTKEGEGRLQLSNDDQWAVEYTVNLKTYMNFEHWEYVLSHEFHFIKENDRFVFTGAECNDLRSWWISSNTKCEQRVDMKMLTGSWISLKQFPDKKGPTNYNKLVLGKNGKGYLLRIRSNVDTFKRYFAFNVNAADSSFTMTFGRHKRVEKVIRLTETCLEMAVNNSLYSERYERM